MCPDWCFHLFMENVAVAFLIQYLIPSQTVKMLPFVTTPHPLASLSFKVASHLVLLPSSQPQLILSPTQSQGRSEVESWGKTQSTQQWIFRSSENNSHSLVASRPYQIQGTWAAGVLSVRPGFESDEVLLTCTILFSGVTLISSLLPRPSTMDHLSGLGILLCCVF